MEVKWTFWNSAGEINQMVEQLWYLRWGGTTYTNFASLTTPHVFFGGGGLVSQYNATTTEARFLISMPIGTRYTVQISDWT